MGRRTWGRLAALAVLSLFLAASAAMTAESGIVTNPNARLRMHQAQPQDLVGNLTWHSGGGVSWTGPDGSADLVPTTDPKAWTQAVDPHVPVPAAYLPPPLIFTSEPVPRDLELNVSRPMELVLYLKPSPNSDICNYGAYIAGYEIRIFVGDKFLGGQVDGHDRFAWPDMYTRGSEGFRSCWYAINPELTRISQGERIRIEVHPVKPSMCKAVYATYPCDPPTLGLSGHHSSGLRISVYNELDAALRSANLTTLVQGSPESGSAGSDAAVLAISLLALLSTRGMSRKRVAGLIILLVLASSGCLSDRAGSPNAAGGNLGPGQLSSSQEPIPSFDPSSGNASLVGQVMDAYGRPVGGAYVAVLGSSAFMSTDALGRFFFDNLHQGTYRLRVDKERFESFEGDVRLIKGEITRVRIEVHAIGTTEDLATRPHYHDYWGGADTVTIFEGGVDGAYFELPASKDAKKLILPGTAEVEIKVEWPDGFRADRVGLMFQENWAAETDYQSRKNWSMLLPREEGKTFHLQTNWDMTDNGHSVESVWSFKLFAMSYDLPRTSEKTADEVIRDYQVAQAPVVPGIGPFDVTIKLHKGVMPLEPPHPDYWKGRTQYNIFEDLEKKGTKSNTDYPIRPPQPVPVDTGTLIVKLVEAPSTYPFKGWQLRYKGGNTTIDDACLDQIWFQQYSRDSCKANSKPAPDPVIDGKTYTWTVQLVPGEGDEIYSGRSRWVLDLLPTPDGDDNARTSTAIPGMTVPSWKVTATVVRAQDAADA